MSEPIVFPDRDAPVEEEEFLPPTVDEAWNDVKRAVRSVGKGDYNEQQGFRFRGIDSILNAVGPALREYGVTVVPKSIIDIYRTEYSTNRGTRMVNKEVRIMWEVRGPAGDSFTGESIGEAADAGDKSITKAQSVAFRQFLIAALAIPTGDPDPDSESHERAAGPSEGERLDPKLEAANEARGELLDALKDDGWTVDKLLRRFQADYSMDLRQVDAATVKAFQAALEDEAKAQKQEENKP